MFLGHYATTQGKPGKRTFLGKTRINLETYGNFIIYSYTQGKLREFLSVLFSLKFDFCENFI